ncbi:MAG: SGNH/GDSL hydrolase family protein [Saprospiraceae bacterium]|nr:SGNH/GDSL hydrolase family protein [Saprospiraceae bacterium]
MKYILLPILLVLTVPLSSQSTKSSTWKGFQRLDFTFQGRSARLVKPAKALEGNPWVWRARFPDYHGEIDSLLLAKGFHVAYVNTNDLFGSPKAMIVWDHFYDYMVDTHALKYKVALSGHSRGGLFIYAWAKRNPSKVACIYGDAAVCDFKSWPGGLGAGAGSPADWEKVMQVYGFSSVAEAKAYQDNPIDQLAALAKAQVPILHTVGLQDKIVPPEENAFLLVSNYQKLGGVATIMPCTRGKTKLEGHHYPIDDPEAVTSFFRFYCLRSEPALQAGDFHTIRGGLKNAQIILEQKETARVAFLGGSITYNPGWRDSICHYLQRKYPDTQFEFIAAGIPSMGTTPGAFRMERDVLSKGKIDLLFEEAAVNDATNGRTKTEQVRAMEGIVRAAKRANPAMDIVIMHFVDPDKMKTYREGAVPAVVQNHNLVAEHYQIPTIDLAREVTERIDNGEFSWADDFKDLHPSPFGQKVYAHSIKTFLENAFSASTEASREVQVRPLPDPIDPYNYQAGFLVDAKRAKYGKGWQLNPNWVRQDKSRVRANFHEVPMLIGEKPGAQLRFRFKGRAIGIAVAAGFDAGMLEYRIDGGAWQKLNLFTKWSKMVHLPWYYTLAAELSNRKHLLELRIADEKDERSAGHACRIRYFYVNGSAD